MKLLLTFALITIIFAVTEAISASPPARWIWVASFIAFAWRADWMWVSGTLRLLPYRDAVALSDDKA